MAALRHQLPVHSPVTARALAAGLWAVARGDPSGRLQRRVEELLRSRYGASDVLLTDSGTSALRLAIEGAVGDSGRPIALPGYGCYDLASAAEGAGAHVLLYDVDPGTLGPTPDALDALRNARPAALVVAHLFGYPVDMRAAVRAAGDALLIEDAAQAAGGELDGIRLGSFGSLSVLSFGRGKGMTGGGGGALLAHDDRGGAVVARASRQIERSAAGRGAARMVALAGQWALGRPSLYAIPSSVPFLHLGETRYVPPFVPGPAPAACLAALERTIEVSDREVGRRRGNAKRLLGALDESSEWRAVAPIPGAEPGYLRLPVLAGHAEDLERPEGARQLGITPMYPRTLAELPSLAPFLLGPRPSLPGAETLVRSLLTLPTHGLLRESDLRALEVTLGAGPSPAAQSRSVRSR